MTRRVLLVLIIAASLLLCPRARAAGQNPDAGPQNGKIVTPGALVLSVDECVTMALKNNKKCPASVYAVEMAEAQYNQALSGFWPQLILYSSYSHLNKEPMFAFPASTIPVAPQTITIPANSFGPFFPPQNVPLQVPAQQIAVPEQDVTLFNRDTISTSLNLTYPLYTGGLVTARAKQAKCGLAIAREESRRTDLEVIYDTKKIYYECLLSRELRKLGNDILARLEVTLELTEKLYKDGSGTVKKTDYLRNKTVVEGVRSAIATLEANEKLAKLALANTMGLPWGTPVEPSQEALPFSPFNADLTQLVNCSYQFNPDWNRLKSGLEAADAKINEANSGHLPTIALVGQLMHFDNSYNYGITTPSNKDLTNVGVNLALPIFDGFLTDNKIKEARAGLHKLEQEQILLKEGLALQVNYIFLRMDEAQKRVKSSQEAAGTSEENRDLNMRAYQEGLVETVDVIESQLVEALMKAQHLKSLFDHAESQAHLDFVVGREVKRIIDGH